MAFIYKITNSVNGKSYIGKTNFTIEKRFKQHISDSKRDRCKDRPLYRAMNKYGVDNFNIEILEETKDPAEREIFYIEYYETYKSGYNATKGGDGKSYVNEDYIIKLLYENDLNPTKVAKISGHDISTVKNTARNNNISLPDFVTPVGEACKQSVLTKYQAIQVKLLYTPKYFGKRRIAKLLNISVYAVEAIVSGKTWKHLEMEIIYS